MNVLEAISKRHSYRGKFKSDPIPKEDLIKIMQAGLEAPSGCNKQTTSLIAVDDPYLLQNIPHLLDANEPVLRLLPEPRRLCERLCLRPPCSHLLITGSYPPRLPAARRRTTYPYPDAHGLPHNASLSS